MDGDEYISITPSRDGCGLWEVNGKFDLTLEQAKAEVVRLMDEYVPEPEIVTVMTREQMGWHLMAEGQARRTLEFFKTNPFLGLLEEKPFQS